MRISGVPILLTLGATLMLGGCGNKGPLVMPDNKPPTSQPPAPASQPGAKGGSATAAGAQRSTDAPRGPGAKASP